MLKKPRFSLRQTNIARSLLDKPKTVEELAKELNVELGEIAHDLKQMLELEVIEKKGFPVKYNLKQEIAEAIKKRREIGEKDAFKLRLKILIEIQAIEENLLKKQLKEILEAIKKDKNFTVYDVFKAEIVKEGQHFASYMEINLSVKNFSSLMRLMVLYGPSGIEVIKPNKIDMSIHELQDGLVLLADIIQRYNEYIAKKMNLEELTKFNQKLFGK